MRDTALMPEQIGTPTMHKLPPGGANLLGCYKGLPYTTHETLKNCIVVVAICSGMVQRIPVYGLHIFQPTAPMYWPKESVTTDTNGC